MIESVYQDEKVAKVLDMLKEGYTRDDIGDYYEQQLEVRGYLHAEKRFSLVQGATNVHS